MVRFEYSVTFLDDFDDVYNDNYKYHSGLVEKSINCD